MTFLERVCSTLNAAKVRYAVVGGYAVALHGAVRGTVDIDIVLRWSRKDLQKVETALNKIKLVSKLPLTHEDVFLYRDEYIKNRNLIAWNFYNPGDMTEQLDVIINFDAKGKKVLNKMINNVTVPVLNVHDLIEMKKKSGRKQDKEDAKALEALQ